MTRKLIATASASALLLVTLYSTPVAAEEVGTMRVKISDLRLGGEPGADRAFRRIRVAAATFCGDDRSIRQLSRIAEIHKCKARMTYLAVTKLDAPLVTARYENSGGQPPILLASR